MSSAQPRGRLPEPEEPGSTPSSVACFDVFDTLLTRAVGDPTAVFLLLGRAIAAEVGIAPPEFRRARIAAEARARRAAGRDVPLSAIYDELATALRWSDGLREAVMERELELEDRLIRPLPDAAARLRRARDAHRVVFLSDMYLPAGRIAGWLERAGLLTPGELCRVSADTGRDKASGDAFRDLIEDLGVDPGAIVHHGDNENSDVRAARAAGVRALPYRSARPNRYERILERHADETGGLTSVLAGASRLARLDVAAADEREGAIRDVAAGVAAPTLVAFVVWILLRAQHAGLRRIYFCSRDGQVLRDIARRVAGPLGVGAELRYLYGGRQAWHLAASDPDAPEALDWAVAPAPGLSVDGVIARLGTDAATLRELLVASVGGSANAHAPLPASGLASVRRALLSAEAAAVLGAHRDRMREDALAYLRQEGLADGTPAAVVDIGWRGNAFRSLHVLVDAAGGRSPDACFFGLLAAPPRELRAPTAYFVDRASGLPPPAQVPSLPILMEVLTAGDHGPVLGYRASGDRIEPRLAFETNRPVVDWGLPILRAAVAAFCDRLALERDLVDVAADARGAVGALLRAFWCDPTAAEASAWGSFPYEVDQAGGTPHPLAEPHSPRALVGALGRGWIEPPRPSSWPAGSLLLTPGPVRQALRAAVAGRGLAHRAWRAWTRDRPSAGSGAGPT